MHLIKYLILSLILSLAACSSLKLKPVNFAWPIESVLEVNKDGFIKEERYSISFNIKNMFIEETGDSLSYLDREIRLIRDIKGYFYITSDNFNNVYVFNVDDGVMHLNKKILISETGIHKPAFNQRPPYIELINGNTKYLLSNNGIRNQGDEEE